MKNGWEIHNLNTLIDDGIITLTRGKIISKKDLFSCPGDFPVYSSAKENDGIFGRYGQYMFDEELITWSVDGGGRLFHRPKHKYSVTNVGGVLRINDRNKLDYRYLYYVLTFLHSQVIFDWVKKAHPSVIRKIYQDIPIPPTSEQHSMVTLLDEAFATIDRAKENATKNLQRAQEFFECYLQSIFANPNKNWERRTLNQISITFGRGKSKNRPRNDKKLYGGKYPFIQTGDISNSDHRITTYTQTYNEVGLAQSKLWPKGTICIAIVGANIAETAILDFDACFPDSVIGIIVNNQITSNKYVEYLLQSFKPIIKAMGKGTARDNINLATFENQMFPFPSIPEQQAIVAKLDTLSAETKKLEAIYQKKLSNLEELKRSILQKAFAGEL
jgi:type I restriction enzyme, S subunit